jgi:heme oxygenase (mycobilin-producing)
MNFVVANRVYVTAEWADRFEERFRHRAGQIEMQSGFVRMEILRPISEGSPYVVLTSWQDKQAFENWVGSEDFKRAHQNPLPKEAFIREGEFEQHEVIISAGETGFDPEDLPF